MGKFLRTLLPSLRETFCRELKGPSISLLFPLYSHSPLAVHFVMALVIVEAASIYKLPSGDSWELQRYMIPKNSMPVARDTGILETPTNSFLSFVCTLSRPHSISALSPSRPTLPREEAGKQRCTNTRDVYYACKHLQKVPTPGAGRHPSFDLQFAKALRSNP